MTERQTEHYRIPVDPAAENNAHAAMLRFVGSGHQVLEVGCSYGHVTEHIVAAGNTVVGVEVDPEAARHAERFAERVHVLDLDTTSLHTVESDRFDVIVLGDVLEHLRDPATTLSDLAGLLDDGGRFVISVPHVGHVDVRLMLLQGHWQYQSDGLLDTTHLRWFTRESLRSLLSDTGLIATRVERTRFGPFFTSLPIDRDAVDHDLIRYIEADPEAHTFQFIVEARRRSDANGDVGDALGEAPAIEWPRLGDGDELEELRGYLIDLRRHDEGLQQHIDALQTELDAWHNARITRLTAPARSLWSRIRGRTA